MSLGLGNPGDSTMNAERVPTDAERRGAADSPGAGEFGIVAHHGGARASRVDRRASQDGFRSCLNRSRCGSAIAAI